MGVSGSLDFNVLSTVQTLEDDQLFHKSIQILQLLHDKVGKNAEVNGHLVQHNT